MWEPITEHQTTPMFHVEPDGDGRLAQPLESALSQGSTGSSSSSHPELTSQSWWCVGCGTERTLSIDASGVCTATFRKDLRRGPACQRCWNMFWS